jgi:hypothetical protein
MQCQETWDKRNQGHHLRVWNRSPEHSGKSWNQRQAAGFWPVSALLILPGTLINLNFPFPQNPTPIICKLDPSLRTKLLVTRQVMGEQWLYIVQRWLCPLYLHVTITVKQPNSRTLSWVSQHFQGSTTVHEQALQEWLTREALSL